MIYSLWWCSNAICPSFIKHISFKFILIHKKIMSHEHMQNSKSGFFNFQDLYFHHTHLDHLTYTTHCMGPF